MKEKVENIKNELIKDLENANALLDVQNLKVKYLGKKGLVTELTSNMRDLSIDEKKEVGMLSNETKNFVTHELSKLEEKINNLELEKKLASEKIDISLPSTKVEVGVENILEKLIEEVESLALSMGYDVVEGPEVEKDLYNFELLNLPKGHPARDAQDTFYLDSDTTLLRSQTSPVQIRTMLENKEKTPIRIICPGKTYRRDDDDATHSHQFTQIEGLIVDKDISLANLKATFDIIAKKLFGEDRETRFRPSFYPFTEPSVELDISCFNCGGKGCNICKGTGWITVGGAGIVHHNVLDNCGYDSNKWTGFAFGFGAERLAMLKYGITDIRTFYTNDLRTKENFDRKDAE
ncbi:MAG: phenylalanine--tRNA ligase subunit alpha [Bacilli bacterium]|nr:phenylalanine--tRNA ligase subunit alpha [Bacilli bacterium]